MAGKIPQKPGKKGDVGYGKPPVEHQFKPGNNANPGGRPKGSVSLTRLIREVLEEESDINVGMCRARSMVLAQVREAENGKAQPFQEIINRIDGAAPKVVDPEDADGPMIFDPKKMNALQLAAFRSFLRTMVSDDGPTAGVA